MTIFEYKVVPAPLRGLKVRGIKGTPERFALVLQALMNEHGAQGWEYQRTDTLPVEERQGLTGKTTTFQNMLVFRRAISGSNGDTSDAPVLLTDQSDIADVDAPSDSTAALEDLPAKAEEAAKSETTDNTTTKDTAQPEHPPSVSGVLSEAQNEPSTESEQTDDETWPRDETDKHRPAIEKSSN